MDSVLHTVCEALLSRGLFYLCFIANKLLLSLYGHLLALIRVWVSEDAEVDSKNPRQYSE